MSPPKIVASATAVPPHRFDQETLVRIAGYADAQRAGFFANSRIEGFAILNPVAPDRVNLGLVVPLRHAVAFRGRMETFFHARLKQLRHLSPRLEGMRPVGRLRVLGPLAYRVDEPRHAGVALVGDAAGFFDPFTGEGLYTALRSAEMLAETAHAALRGGQVSAEALAPYWRARRRAFAAKERVTRVLQWVIARRRLATLTAHVLVRRPALLGTLMGVIGDFVPPGALLRPSLLRRDRSCPGSEVR